MIVLKGEPRRLFKLLLAGCFILDDLLLQMFLVCLNVPWPLGHCSILTHPYLFSNLQTIRTACCWHTIYAWIWFPFIQNLQFSVKYLHGICLALYVSIRQIPVFQTMMYEKLLTFYSGKHRISKTRKWVDIFLRTYKFYECETSTLYHNSGTYIFMQKMIQMTNTWLISLKSWLTSTMPPSKSLIASASASIVSMSKWFVGSSNSKRWGACHARYANTTRQRCPSLSCRIGHT